MGCVESLPPRRQVYVSRVYAMDGFSIHRFYHLRQNCKAGSPYTVLKTLDGNALSRGLCCNLCALSVVSFRGIRPAMGGPGQVVTAYGRNFDTKGVQLQLRTSGGLFVLPFTTSNDGNEATFTIPKDALWGDTATIFFYDEQDVERPLKGPAYFRVAQI